MPASVRLGRNHLPSSLPFQLPCLSSLDSTLSLPFQPLWLRRHGSILFNFYSLIFSLFPLASEVPTYRDETTIVSKFFLGSNYLSILWQGPGNWRDESCGYGWSNILKKWYWIQIGCDAVLDVNARPNSACGTSSSNLSFTTPFSSLDEHLVFSHIFLSYFFSYQWRCDVQRTKNSYRRVEMPNFYTRYKYQFLIPDTCLWYLSRIPESQSERKILEGVR